MVGALLSGDILLTQFSLVLAPVALVEVVKCLIPVFVLAGTSMLHFSCPKLLHVIIVITICLGVALATGSGGVDYDIEPRGTLMASLAAIVAGARSVAMQVLLQGDRKCPVPLLLIYVSMALLSTSIVVFLHVELSKFAAVPAALRLECFLGSFFLIALSSILAFALNLSELWCIRATSALVISIVGAAKTVLLVLATAIVAGKMLSLRASIGCILAIGGTAAMRLCSSSTTSDESPARVELRPCSDESMEHNEF
eukprot:CAMPEP_0117538252 /NCGR_PEP_ID=MMETSP0784-20121206/42384_1 /TAXON_ID=39447 /ORGANISM="" /LENGTH=254 /DNA_ID=CAMNT_0005334863 /DNA_START=328 /DNA_END=1092 /DNA_ORIENTATION=-